ncbi:MAG: hypothetical protein ABSA47_10555 [Verrucomicrobiota bacterium]|jgi:hypothetical protein
MKPKKSFIFMIPNPKKWQDGSCVKPSQTQSNQKTRFDQRKTKLEQLLAQGGDRLCARWRPDDRAHFTPPPRDMAFPRPAQPGEGQPARRSLGGGGGQGFVPSIVLDRA